jgi:hypothetical protein
MIAFEQGAHWCAENKLFYNLDIKNQGKDDSHTFYITIYSRDENGDIEDFVTGQGPNKDEAMSNAREKWGEGRKVSSCDLLHLCLDMIDHVDLGGVVITPTQKHPEPFHDKFLIHQLRAQIANHLKE